MEMQKNTRTEHSRSIPQLRFPEFYGDWERKMLGEIYKFKVTNSYSRADLNYEYGDVMNIHYGDIHTQFATLFDIEKERIPYINGDINIKKIPDENYCKEGDLIFADASEDYNDIGKSIEILNLKNAKVLSGLHTILARPEKKSMAIGYAGYLMKSPNIRLQIQKEAQGTKVLSISSGRLSKININFPTIPEQQKIASFFTAIDQKISQLKQKKTLLEQYKKGVMQKIFSQQIRFKEDNGQDYQKWENKKLSEYLCVSKNKNFTGKYGKEDVLSVSGDYGIVNQIEFQGRSFAGESVLNYGEVETGDIVYTKSPLKNNPYGIIKVNKGKAGIVSTLYAVYKCKDNALGEYFDYYFQLDEKLNGYLRPLVHKGAKNDMKINNERVLIDTLSVPCKKEQEKIVTFFNAIDNKINHTQKQIEKAEVWKKGLMQQMFV